MKANEAPEKLYLISDEDGVILSYDSSTKLQYGNRYDFVDKEVFPIEEECEVEYVRKDAFIEKAEEFIYSALNDGIMGTANIEDFMRLFKNHMKGE